MRSDLGPIQYVLKWSCVPYMNSLGLKLGSNTFGQRICTLFDNYRYTCSSEYQDVSIFVTQS
jgi:hypothetical protein